MLSVVIPVLNAGPGLYAALRGLAGEVDEIVVVDGGSADGSATAAARAGAVVVRSERGRGRQLAEGALRAKGDWLLFLHADTRPESDWRAAAAVFMQGSGAADRAGYFRLAFDDPSRAARRTAWIANWRARALGLPYGDQGLLLSRAFYDALGGYRPLPLMEDVDIVRRIGRRRLTPLPVLAVTSAAKYRASGWTRRSLRNLFCLALYFLGAPPSRIAKLYG